MIQIATLLVMTMLRGIEAVPHFIISSGKSHCETVTAPHSTKLRVEYEAPDLDVSGSSEPNVWITVKAKIAKPGSVNNAQDWNNHFKRNLGVDAGSLKPASERITKKAGAVVYETQQNGQVEVCLRAGMAASSNPMRFALRVEKETEVHAHSEDAGDEDKTDTNHHLTHMEMELKHLMSSMKDIISEADFSKERETHFHQQTLNMHAASMWWPIVQLCVLLLTGFTQANHVVRFLKSKRLI
mmetsp:Transcript_12417/g.20576  ORF Transcript_12417/g.20576 Transcript_12417/m.20576 type:complete len:241 (-) Transcript_12417:66-788(-)